VALKAEECAHGPHETASEQTHRYPYAMAPLPLAQVSTVTGHTVTTVRLSTDVIESWSNGAALQQSCTVICGNGVRRCWRLGSDCDAQQRHEVAICAHKS
jgi:hypothetical protein